MDTEESTPDVSTKPDEAPQPQQEGAPTEANENESNDNGNGEAGQEITPA